MQPQEVSEEGQEEEGGGGLFHCWRRLPSYGRVAFIVKPYGFSKFYPKNSDDRIKRSDCDAHTMRSHNG